ncbi:conserved hypothetical protein [Halobacteriovorax marinus SJ]|uniref:L,D-TPase catalytic domain-containing protein n=1 Tax=Halobacteriovorax marinus (strain ATCC BAA-682 / DSM 15412 / SJ) TaxID=862908 RepID=E1X0X9_HALMS|nr:L,D-transpeptidase family protein [Halobacteriovorax marinus]CBW26468.1 conserved hypothetical protein [Halobacteriovorax marinus SJ]
MKKVCTLITLLILSFSGFAKDKITQIVVLKDKREMQLWSGNEIYKVYNIKLSIAYNNPLFRAHEKRREGDNQTPVGFYKISKKRQRTNFPKSLLINYPNWKDKHNAKIRGIPEDEIGGMILIHGNPYRVNKTVRDYAAKLGIEADTVERWARDYFYPFFDWTNGCVAVTDEEMDEIFELVDKDTPINIYP